MRRLSKFTDPTFYERNCGAVYRLTVEFRECEVHVFATEPMTIGDATRLCERDLRDVTFGEAPPGSRIKLWAEHGLAKKAEVVLIAPPPGCRERQREDAISRMRQLFAGIAGKT